MLGGSIMLNYESDEYVEDEAVYHYEHQDSGTWEPNPPSEASMSVLETTAVKQRKEKSLGSWRRTSNPKPDAYGKPTALWDKPEMIRFRKDREQNTSVVGGIDCISTVKRLSDCWLLPKGTCVSASTDASMLTYVDFFLKDAENHVNGILKRSTKEMQQWQKVWRDADEKSKNQAKDIANDVSLSILKANMVEEGLNKINEAERDIVAALKSEGLLHSHEDNQERSILDVAATVIQALWKGSRKRHQIHQQYLIEFAELEALLAAKVSKNVFQKRDLKALEKEAKKRAVATLESKELEMMDEVPEVDARDTPRSLKLPPGVEAAKLSTDPRMGAVMEIMGSSFDVYISKLWRIFSVIRAHATREGKSFSDLMEEFHGAISFSSEDGRISRHDLECILEKLDISSYHRNVVLTFLDFEMNGLISVDYIIGSIQGALSNRRALLCNLAFDKLFFHSNSKAQNISSRLWNLKNFYEQFVPDEVTSGKPEELHKKYKDTPKVNKELFEKLYQKYVKWLKPPAYVWDPDASRREQEKVCTINALTDMHGKYQDYLRHSGDNVAKLAIERALVNLKFALTSPDIIAWRSDWLGFHAELSAGVTNDSVFEHMVCRIAGISTAEWLQVCEKQSRRELVHTEKLTWRKSTQEAEIGKVLELKTRLSGKEFENYMNNLNNVLRKIRNVLVSVSGAKISYRNMEEEFQCCSTFGDDRKIGKMDFENALGRLGVRLTSNEMRYLTLHFDTTNDTYVSVDAFLFQLRARDSNKTERVRSANEVHSSKDLTSIRKRWGRAICGTIIPESKKEWTVHFATKNGAERPFWYCRITHERTWTQPLNVANAGKESSKKGAKKRAKWALNKLQTYRDQANLELDQLMDIVRSFSNSILCIQKANRIPTCVLGSNHFYDLRTMYLDSNDFNAVPDVVLDCKDLRRLVLSNNGIRSWPKRCALNNLELLVLSRNRIQVLPKCVNRLRNLQELLVDGNQLVEIHEDAFENLRVRVLNLENNRLATLPEDPWKSMRDHLVSLNLGNNQLVRLPLSFGAGTYFECLTFLSLKDNRLGTLPEGFGKGFLKLEKLELQGNNLLSLPCSIGDLKELQILYLQHNALTELPDSIGHLLSLKDLHVNNNRLEQLPDSLGHLLNLENLYLQCNRVKSLPDSFQYLQSIKEIWLHQNDLKKIQVSFPISLTVLKVHNNQIEEICSSIASASELEYLDLGGNRLKSVPLAMYRMKKISYIRLDDNPLEQALGKVVKSGIFSTVDEEAYGMLLRKLVDCVRHNNTQAKIDAALGISVQEALEMEKRNRLEMLQKKKDVQAAAVAAFTLPEMDESKPPVRAIGRTLVQQKLSQSLRMFSQHSGNDGEHISQKTFHFALQIIGNLLTTHEVNRFTARVFHMYDTQDSGIIKFDDFVESLGNRHGKEPGSRPLQVATAVLRYCTAKHAALSHATLKKIKKSSPQNHPVLQESPSEELLLLASRKKKLDEETVNVQRKLEESTKKATIVEKLNRTADPVRPRGRNRSSSPRDDGTADEKKTLQSQVREQNRKLMTLRRSLAQVDGVARHYTDAHGEEWEDKCKRERIRKQRMMNHHRPVEEVEKAKKQVHEKRTKLDKLKVIFTACARTVGSDGLVLTKGDMISAAEKYFRTFDKGRMGLEPREWRLKLLSTVNEAFSSGYTQKKTGKYVAFDRDDDGYLDFPEFQAFCKELDKRIVDDKSEISTEAHQEVEQIGEGFVLVDLCTTVGIMRVEIRNLQDTVGSLKAKIEFNEMIPRKSQILIFNSKRLDDAQTLAEAGLRIGSTLKLVVST